LRPSHKRYLATTTPTAKFAIFLCVALTAFAGLAEPQAARESLVINTFHNPVTLIPIYNTSFVLEEGNKAIYVDPAAPVSFAGLPPADIVLITDATPAHMDRTAIAAVGTPGTEIIAPPAAAKIITRAHALKSGEMTNLFGWFITAVPLYTMKRNSGAGQQQYEQGSGNGYVLTYGSKSFYISGDTGDAPGVRALKGIDVAFIRVSATSAMTSEEAAAVVKDLHPQLAIPYGDRNLAPFAELLEHTGIEVKLFNWFVGKP
jgi:L-ascorbate metabolism protein UlaG (beta-lactamase superfamily)